MTGTASDGGPKAREARPHGRVRGAPRVCLRCDWTGDTDATNCPDCDAPLYRPRAYTSPVVVTPTGGAEVDRDAVPNASVAAVDTVQPQTADAPPRDDNAAPVVPLAAGRRWWASRRRWVAGGAVTLAALWILVTAWPFDRPIGPLDRPSARSPVADTAVRRGNEVLVLGQDGLSAIDRDTGEVRTILAVGTSPPPTDVDGEVIDGEIATAAWSSDGRWIAFDGPDGALWVMDAEMDIRRLAHTAGSGWVWSPTRAQVAMILRSTLTVIDAATGRIDELGQVDGDVTSAPVWSPDGTRLVYGARGGSIFAVDVQSERQSLVVRLPGDHLDSVDEIEWSPDGARLAIMNDLQPGAGRLYLMHADGSEVLTVFGNFQPRGLAWSPDGETLAYATDDRLGTITRVDGSPSTIVLSGNISDPVWSPDGSRIGYDGTGRGTLPAWYAVDADGMTPRVEIDELTYQGWKDAEGQGGAA
jgi:dipeptidyl aminopeptidase/acylaminoacyl peptidase